MKYKAVIFDMDGTILNTLEDLKNATNYSLRQFNMQERTLEEVRMFVGNGIRKLVERAVPAGTSAEKIDEVLDVFLKYYEVHSADNTSSYPGIHELVEKLKAAGIKTAVSTNKADAPAQELGKEYFNGIFDLIVGQRDGLRTKPAPDSVNEILKILNIQKKDAVYVGDSDVDVQTAANSGLDFIGVSWGFRGRKFLQEKGAKNIVDSADEILDLVK